MKAIFLGKFQPPHLGHIRTILKVAQEYESLVVGVTMGDVRVLAYEEVQAILEEVLGSHPHITVQLIEGTIEGGTANLQDLDFDVILSGNHKVLSILEAQGFQVKFQPRTEGKGYSGSALRELMDNKKAAYIRDRAKGYKPEIIPLSSLKPLERVYPAHFRNIEKLIVSDGIIKKPIIVDSRHHVVLDGSHRYAFLLKHGYQFAPVVIVNYDDDAIFVGNRLRHRYLSDDEYRLTKSEVIDRALSETLFSARTTRHFFPFRKTDYPVPLQSLEKGPERNIDYLFDTVSIETEISADKKYVAEIDEELHIIDDYIREQQGVKDYLLYQIIEMEKERARTERSDSRDTGRGE